MKAETMTVAVVGLGYVGLPLAVEFGKKYSTIGFDLSAEKVAAYRRHHDPTGELSSEDLKAATRLLPTTDPTALRKASFVVVAVPTPVDGAHTQTWRRSSPPARRSAAISSAAQRWCSNRRCIRARPRRCIPIIEQHSGLKWREDFFVGYSPERINLGQGPHAHDHHEGGVRGQPETLEHVAEVYGSIIRPACTRLKASRWPRPPRSSRTMQRDLIALVNELSLIFHRIGIETLDVLNAAGTK
jgi:UDP-N-acetyl-D-galactosamine dehydrogenase